MTLVKRFRETDKVCVQKKIVADMGAIERALMKQLPEDFPDVVWAQVQVEARITVLVEEKP